MQHNRRQTSPAPPLTFILSILFQLILTPIAFIFVVFSAASLANNENLTKLQSLILDASLLAIPSIPILTAFLLLILHTTQSKFYHLAWNLISIASITIYLTYALSLTS